MRAVWPVFAAVAASISAVPVASGAADGSPRDSLSITRARTIQLEVSNRYARSSRDDLEVTEASSAGVVESFTLISTDPADGRILPAENGIYYAICPVGATCPYPARRFARSAASFVPRRMALELAVRTFRETSADVVAVSLPTRRFVLFIVTRAELAEDDQLPLAEVTRDPGKSPSVRVRNLIDRATRPRVYAVIGLEPTQSGRDTVGAVPVWPRAGAEEPK